MLMLDVRNAIAGILDRYTLADVVEITLRKLRRNGLPLPFSVAPADAAAARTLALARRQTTPRHAARLEATEGVLHQLLGDYSI
jgi:hypothetical protein